MRSENKDWNAIWDKQTEDVFNNPNNDIWTADYTDGYVEIEVMKDVFLHQNKYWINDKTGERVTNEEHERRLNLKFPKPKGSAIESFKFEILDFGKNIMT